jgi:hypothetical protein
MPRRVFFSFHYERDAWRAGIVRNSWVTKPDREAAGFWDAADWEQVKSKGEDAVKNWINRQLEGTSVTVVLIGSETSEREYVVYELKQSYGRGNGIIGVYIHKLKDQQGKTDNQGKNPLDSLYIEKDRQRTYLSQIYPTYDWVGDDGYNRFADWIEESGQKAKASG